MTSPAGGVVLGRESRGRPVAPSRLAIFTSHPIQYQAPYFRALALDGEVEPTVFFGSTHGSVQALDRGFGKSFSWDTPVLEGFPHVVLENCARRPDVSRFLGVRTDGIRDRWTADDFDACLVLGWQTLAHVQAIRAAWRSNLPLLVRGDSNLAQRPSAAGRARLRAALWLPVRERAYRSLFARVDAFLVTGRRNRDYYRHFGVPDARLFDAPHCVDNAHFALPEPARATARASVRAGIGVDEETVVFVVPAKIITMKRPLDVLQAFADLPRGGPRCHLVFLGDGVLRDDVERRADVLGVRDHVTIAGFINQSEMPAWYAAGDALVLASDAMETWGLAVNEAMAAGLPVILSDAVGCVPDLARDGENGFVFPLGDIVALAERMNRLRSSSSRARAAMGQRSREIVATFSVDRLVAATRDALAHVRQRSAR